MSAIRVFIVLSVLSATFAQDFLQAPSFRKVIIQNRAPEQNINPMPSSGTSNAVGQLEETDLNSPILSKFAEYNLQVLEDEGIYPLLFDVTLSPDVIRENFYNEAIYFALENGLYEVGSFPQQLADAAVQAFPNLTPLEYFKVVSNTLEHLLQNGGIATEGNYQVLVRLNAKAFKIAMESIEVNDAKSALHAIIKGAGILLDLLSLDSPDNVRFAITTFADQFSKVPLKGNF